MKPAIALIFAFLVLFIAPTAFAEAPDLLELAGGGTANDISAALSKGGDINARDSDGHTPIMHAAQFNPRADVIRVLMKAGAKLNDLSKTGLSPFLIAAGNNTSVPVIEAFLKAGAKVNEKVPDGRTPLIQAAAHNDNPLVVETLLRAGAEIGAQDKNGGNAFSYALVNNPNIEIAKLLLDRGADMKARVFNGVTILMSTARATHYPAAIPFLIEAGAAADERLQGGTTALILAAAVNPITAVTAALLEAGADVNAAEDQGITPLMAAAQYNQNPEVAAFLLRSGANVNALSKIGIAAIHEAALDNTNPVMADVILKGGADPSLKDPEGRTPLMYAAMKNPNPRVVATLLRGGSEIDARDNKGFTALMHAGMKTKNPRVIVALLEGGADASIQGTGGMTALAMARANNPNPGIVPAFTGKDALPKARASDIAFCNKGPLNIRKAPSLTADILGTVDTYEPVTIIEKSEKTVSVDGFQSYWYRLRSKGGTEGWAFGGYLEIFSSDARIGFNGLFSMELPAGAKVSNYPCVAHPDENGFTFTQSHLIDYLGRSVELIVYYVPRETTRLETLLAKFKSVVNPVQPSLSLDRLSSILEYEPSFRQTDDWTNIAYTASSVNSETVHDVLIANFRSTGNPLFSGAYLVFPNLWKDGEEVAVSKMNLGFAAVNIAAKRLVAQNYEMVLNALSTVNLLDEEEE
jgi:uncharacterized protein